MITNKPNGFSLFELSVVITVTAVIMSMMIAGIAIKESAVSNQIIGEIYSYRKIIATFYNERNFLPGDAPNVDIIFNSCIVNANPTCFNGNGNRAIDINPSSTEQYQLWLHLYYGNYLITRYSGQPVLNGNGRTVAGINVPSSTVIDDAGYMVHYKPWQEIITNIMRKKYNMLDLQNFQIQDESGIGFAPSISSAMLSKIDNKIDDGLPLEGTVLAIRPPNQITGCHSGQTNNYANDVKYAATSKKVECIMSIILDELPIIP